MTSHNIVGQYTRSAIIEKETETKESFIPSLSSKTVQGYCSNFIPTTIIL